MSRELSGISFSDYLSDVARLELLMPKAGPVKRLHQRSCGGWFLMTDFEIRVYEIGLRLERKTCGTDGRRLSGPRFRG